MHFHHYACISPLCTFIFCMHHHYAYFMHYLSPDTTKSSLSTEGKQLSTLPLKGDETAIYPLTLRNPNSPLPRVSQLLFIPRHYEIRIPPSQGRANCYLSPDTTKSEILPPLLSPSQSAIYPLTLRNQNSSLPECYLFPHTTTLTPFTSILLSIPSHYDTHSVSPPIIAIYSLTLQHHWYLFPHTTALTPVTHSFLNSCIHAVHTCTYTTMYDLAVILSKLDQKWHAHEVTRARVYSVVIPVYRPHFFTPLLLAC